MQELATRTVIAMAAGASSLAGPDAAAAATALTPIAEGALDAVVRVVGSRRRGSMLPKPWLMRRRQQESIPTKSLLSSWPMPFQMTVSRSC